MKCTYNNLIKLMCARYNISGPEAAATIKALWPNKEWNRMTLDEVVMFLDDAEAAATDHLTDEVVKQLIEDN